MKATDWTSYYSHDSIISRVTRNYAQNILLRTIETFCAKNPIIFECGGGNSCFFQRIYQKIKPSSYTVIDNNDYSLRLFQKQYGMLPNVQAIKMDIAMSNFNDFSGGGN